ncbi:NUDIX domain-containing protein [Streptomyces sp. NPDC090442]|uniref:NUDIX domain-containing protein n=1 Tax=Streptomyces sp. NPDC090442 TaxID=3365962 RepID=UPI003821FF0C
MRELTLRIRVAAYVLRRRAGRPVELPVFDHDADLSSGTQVPAGGGGPQEPLEEAVLREVAEESGVTCVRVRRPIAEETPRTRSDALRVTPRSSNWRWPATRTSRMRGTTT